MNGWLFVLKDLRRNYQCDQSVPKKILSKIEHLIDDLVGLFRKGFKKKNSEFLRSKKSEFKKLVKEKKYSKVFKLGSEILEKNPDDIDVSFVLGGLYFMEGKFSKAILCFDKVLEISSFDPEALLLKANSHFKLGQYKKSISCCEKIKEIDPKNKGLLELLEKIPKTNID